MNIIFESELLRLKTLTGLSLEFLRTQDQVRLNALQAISNSLGWYLAPETTPDTDYLDTLSISEILNDRVNRPALCQLFSTYCDPTWFPYAATSTDSAGFDGYSRSSAFKKVAWLTVLFSHFQPILPKPIRRMGPRTRDLFASIDNYQNSLFGWHFARNEAFAKGNVVADNVITSLINPSHHQLTDFCEVFTGLSHAKCALATHLALYKSIALVFESWVYEANKHLKYPTSSVDL